ncbi:MAG: amidase [Clostridiales bacterium]|nr:MAG: amidase [Clostridiales bacterium]
MNLTEISIKEYHRALLEGRLSTEKLLDYFLERIEKYDKKINSIIAVNPSIREEAKKMDKHLKENGLVGPLHGVFVLVKDNIETKDMPTTAGSKSLEDFNSGKDAFILENLRKQGALVIAKANLHEFAIWGETISSILGQTYNPYDLTRTPGGSSGGTGAGLACDFAMIGIGTDTINSVRSPSSANSLYGLRPTLGLLSATGIVPYSLTQDTAGPMAKNVDDLEIMFDAMRGYDEKDEATYSSYLLKRFKNYSGIKGKKLGLLKSLFGKKEENEEVNVAVNSAVERFKKLGVEIVEIDDNIDSVYLSSNVSVHLYDLKADLEEYLKSNSVKYDTIEKILESGKHHEGIKENLMKASKLEQGSEEYVERRKKAKELVTKLLHIFEENKIEGLVYPHQQQLVCKAGKSQLERNGVLASVTGFPSIAMPAGFSSANEDAPLGVPVGFEILGRPYEDKKLIQIAKEYERAFGPRVKPNL